MERALQKTEIKGYCKDEGNRAILQTDAMALKAYKKKKEQLNRIDAMDTKINNIETDISEIKDMLGKLLNG